MVISKNFFLQSSLVGCDKRAYYLCVCIFCVVSPFFISGCWKHLTRNDLIGNYKADFGFATAKLILQADGRFTQYVWIKSQAKRMVAKGDWKYSSGNDYIVFDHHYMFINDFDESHPHFEQSPKGMIAIPPVGYQLGQIQIGGDDIPWGNTLSLTPYIKQ